MADLESLAKIKGNNKFSGVFVKDTSKGKSYYIAYRDENNKTIKRKLNIPNLTDNKALNELQKVKTEIREIKAGNESKVKLTRQKASTFKTLNEMADFYFEYHDFKTKEGSKGIYDLHFRDDEIGKKLFKLITLQDLKLWQKAMINKNIKIHNARNKTRKMSNKTINNVLAVGIAIIRYARKNEKYDGEILLDRLEKLKVDNVRLKTMTDEEIELLFNKLKEEAKTPLGTHKAYLYAILALTLGAREQTILNIKKSDIDFKNNIIHLDNFKSDRKYKLPLIEEVKILLEQERDDYIFINERTKKLYSKAPASVKRILDRFINVNRDDDGKIRIRDLRNVFATRLINQGESLSFISSLLDHKTTQITQRYAQMLETAGHEELKNSKA